MAFTRKSIFFLFSQDENDVKFRKTWNFSIKWTLSIILVLNPIRMGYFG